MLVVGRNNFNEKTKLEILEDLRKRIDECWDRVGSRVAVNLSLLGTSVLDVAQKEFTDWIRKEVEREFESRGVEIQCIVGYEVLRNTPSIYIVAKDSKVIGNDQNQ